jgi:hypothetical protein
MTFLLDLETGERVLWKELATETGAGVSWLGHSVVVNPEGTHTHTPSLESCPSSTSRTACNGRDGRREDRAAAL